MNRVRCVRAILLAAAFAGSAHAAHATYVHQVSGSGGDVIASSGVPVQGCSFLSDTVTALGCETGGSQRVGDNIVTTTAIVQAAVDGLGIHLYVKDEVVLSGFGPGVGYLIRTSSEADASFSDVVRLRSVAAMFGFMSMTLHTEGLLGIDPGGFVSFQSNLFLPSGTCQVIDSGR